MRYDSWNTAGYDRTAAAGLYRAGINPLLSVVLASRGVTDETAAKEFLDQERERFTDPMALRDMDRAAERIRRATEAGERVAVYGDYDADGITAACLLSDVLERMGLRCETYIPRRLEEGYGVRRAGLDALHEKGVTLTVTVDCGITAVEETEYARSLGMDLVITDHHECGAALPDTAAVDPKRSDNGDTETGLAGVGVAFKLACALAGPGSERAVLDRYGDLVALGTIGDVMPVLGENRTLIRAGLNKLRTSPRPGLLSLCEAAGIDMKKLTASGVSYGLVPRLNAAGRMGSVEGAVELLRTGDPERAVFLAEEMNRYNRERQQTETRMTDEALEMLRTAPAGDRPMVLASEGWHQGIAGIVAARLCDRFSLPAVVICLKDGEGRGSCRSVGNFNIYEALSSCRDLLTAFGGHEMAAGLTVPEENVDALRGRLGELYQAAGGAGAASELRVDAELPKPEILTEENVSALSLLEPCGSGNPTPVFSMTEMEILSVYTVGGGRHTRLRLGKNGTEFEGMFFGRTPEALGAVPGRRADAAFTPQINEYRGRRSVQLRLSDLAVK